MLSEKNPARGRRGESLEGRLGQQRLAFRLACSLGRLAECSIGGRTLTSGLSHALTASRFDSCAFSMNIAIESFFHLIPQKYKS